MNLFDPFLGFFSSVLKTLSGTIFLAVAFLGMLVYFKYIRRSLFALDPDQSERFVAWYKENPENYDDKNEAVHAYLEVVDMANKYEVLYGRRERARQLFYERQDAWYYLRSLERNYGLR